MDKHNIEVTKRPEVLKTKENNKVYQYKTKFGVTLNTIDLELIANIKLKLKEDKNLISVEDSLLARIMGLTDLCCDSHAIECLNDSVNPELLALGLEPMTLEDSLRIKHLVETEISYFIIDLHSKLKAG